MMIHLNARPVRTFVASAICLLTAAGVAAIDYKIVTASERGTYFAIGKDLSRFVAPAAKIELEVLPTDGSAANIKHLRYDPGVKLAIVQADVYQAFLDRATVMLELVFISVVVFLPKVAPSPLVLVAMAFATLRLARTIS